MLDFANANIPAPDGMTENEHNDGDTSDIINVILKQDNLLGNYMCDFAQAYSADYTSMNALWNFTHKYIKYVADQPGLEVVKDPRVTWKHRSGDCKSFSIFIASVLKCLGIPYRYRFAAYSPGDPTHVYVIAKINNQDVIMDATIDKFNHEITYHKKWDKVTKIVRMHGATRSIKSAPAIKTKNAVPTTAQRIANAPRIGIPQPYIDYSGLTEGELTLRLLDENAKILAAYYGDPNGTFQKVRNYIFNASKNLHSITGHIGYVDPKFYNLFSYIEYAKERSKPAGIASARIGDFASDRDALIKNCDYTSSEYLKWQAGGKTNPITKEKTPIYYPRKKDGTLWDLNDLSKAKLACDDQRFFLDLFNSHLEKSAAHTLYEFIADSELNSLPGTANFKANNHRLANSSMSRYSQLDRTNIVLWQRNGIMRRSAASGLIEISPEAMINNWKQIGKEGIGLDPATAALIVSIISAAFGAASELLKLLLLKKSTFSSEVRGYGSTTFGPEQGDFAVGTSNDFQISDFIPYAAAGAGIYLLTSK